MTQITHWINGAPDTKKPERTGDIYNPATGKVTGTVAFGNAATVDSAVSAATAAFAEWRHSSLTKRTQVLFAFRELVAQNKEKIAALITAEHGKVLSDAAGEVTRGLEVVEFACGIPHLLKGGFSEEVSTGVDVYSIRQALGPVAIISPFNFPAMVPMWFFPVAIACGNTVVVKPSEKDPSAAMFMAQLWKEAGLPDGVFNIVHGDKEVVDALLVHPGIKSISFVGSTPIARCLRAQSLPARTSRPVSRRRENGFWRGRFSPSGRRRCLCETPHWPRFPEHFPRLTEACCALIQWGLPAQQSREWQQQQEVPGR